jgi:hypothetical protein
MRTLKCWKDSETPENAVDGKSTDEVADAAR